VSDILVVTSKVKALAKAKNIRTSDEFVTALSAEVQRMVEESIIKAVDAKRKTLKAEDLG
jgi:histone H3/H4